MAEAPSASGRGKGMADDKWPSSRPDGTSRGRRRMETAAVAVTAIWRQLRSKIECIAKREEQKEEPNQYIHRHGIDMRFSCNNLAPNVLASDAF